MIRPFAEEDVPRVAELRRLCFRHSVWHDEAALRSALRRVFFDHPWVHETWCPPGFVEERANGEIIGFVGLVPRRAVYQGQSVSAAVASQLMVHPEYRGGRSSLLLVERVAGVGADLLLTDSITDKALRLWRRVGGSLSPATRLHWEIGGWKHIVKRTLRSTRRATPGADTQLLDWNAIAQPLLAALPGDTLVPEMAAPAMRWLEQRIVERYGEAALQRAQVIEEGLIRGWFVYLLRGREAQVLQLIGLAGAHEIVFQQFMEHASSRGARRLSGRFQTSLLQPVSRASGVYRLRGNGLAFLTRDPDLFRAIMEDRSWISGLDGEWWLPF